jgi:hypothetical protein
VGDEAFPLKKYLLRPYPGVSTLSNASKHSYNYTLSRAYRNFENASSILTQKFRLFYCRIQQSSLKVEIVVSGTCVLHGYSLQKSLSKRHVRGTAGAWSHLSFNLETERWQDTSLTEYDSNTIQKLPVWSLYYNSAQKITVTSDNSDT